MRTGSTGTTGVLIGAAFLMATSAVGPGFLTQTAVFTERLGPSFGFAILVSIVIDLVAQLNIWRVLAVTGKRAPDVANGVAPGLGTALALLVAAGGLAFNIGNLAGAGLGASVALNVSVAEGAAASALIAVALFVVKEAGRAMDRFAIVLGFVLVALTCYVAIASGPPVGAAIHRTILPEQIDLLTIVTIVGGTVGGYITFAGAHRLVDAGVKGVESVDEVSRSALTAIGVASLMRVVLFLAALGVVSRGLTLDPTNPPASVFRHATGEIGYRVFGLVMWSAAITSVVGAAYTSVSFLRGLHGAINRQWTRAVIAFIVVSAIIFLWVGRPVRTLIAVGALNGLILPLALGAMLLAAHKRQIVGTYRHSRWLTAAGAVVALAMAGAGAIVLWRDIPQLMR
jgi:Mn2+/Fe2+ NRAMP family transporter